MVKVILTGTLLLISILSEAQCFVKIQSGEQHTMAIADDGTLWGWGSNTSGELGMGTSSHVNTPTQIGTFNDWVDVDCGTYHTIAMRSNGLVYTCGYNSDGQCGTGNTGNVLTLGQVATNATEIAAGGKTSFYISDQGQLYASGNNVSGQFGNGSNMSYTSFILVSNDTDWEDVEVAWSHAIALKGTNRLLYTTGNNSYGQLGSGNNTSSTTWTNYIGGSWDKIGVGTSFTAILAAGGHLMTCGRNNYGQLGNGDNVLQQDVYVPTATSSLISMGTIQDFACGFDNVIVINTSGTVYSWGRNQYNLGGMGQSTHNWTPYPWNVSWGNATAVSMGLFMAHVSTDQGTWSWGKNDRGQLGNGNNTDNSTPNANLAGCSIGLPCSIDNANILGTTPCNPANDTYSTNIEVYFTNPPASGTLVANGINFTVTASPMTITLNGTADGGPVDLDLSFSDDASCSYFMSSAWLAPDPCSSSVGIDENTSTFFRLSPNPAEDQLTIELDQATTIEVINSMGTLVFSRELNPGQNELDISKLDAGVYLIRTASQSIKRFIKL